MITCFQLDSWVVFTAETSSPVARLEPMIQYNKRYEDVLVL
jgi:hypothetical protein